MTLAMTPPVERYVGTADAWDGFGAAQPGWTAFHRHAYGQSIADTFGHEVQRWCVRAPDGSLAGLLPLVRVQSRLFGHFLVSMPFASYGGPVGDDAAVSALAQHADALATGEGVDLLELRSVRALPVTLPVTHRKITVVLPLAAGGPEAVMAALKSKLRSQIRRPGKEGIVVRMGHDQIAPFFQVFSQHMRDLGTPTLPRAWFESLGRTFGEDVWFACAWLGEVPVACGAGFRWGSEFEITWASALRAHNAISPNMAVYWALIEQASQLGLARFNFGRCTPESPTHRFKTQWGALDEPLYWYQGSAGKAAAAPNPDSPKFRMATKVWSRLPVGLTRAVGPRLVKFIP